MALRIRIVFIAVPVLLTWVSHRSEGRRDHSDTFGKNEWDSIKSYDNASEQLDGSARYPLHASRTFDSDVYPLVETVQDSYQLCDKPSLDEHSFKSGLCCRGSELIQDILYRCEAVSGVQSRAWWQTKVKPSWNCLCSMCMDLMDDFDVTRLETKVTSKLVVTYHELTPKTLTTMNGLYPVGPRYILYLLPEFDRKGAFGFSEEICERIRCFKKTGHHFFLRRVQSIAAAEKVLKAFPDGSLHHVSLRGRGSERRLAFGSSDIEGYALTKRDSRTSNFLKLLRRKLLPTGASVFLASSKSAKKRLFGVWNIWQLVASKLPGTKVIASKSSLGSKDLHVPATGVCLPHDAIMVVSQGKDVTAVTKQVFPNCKRYGEGIEREVIVALLQAQRQCLSRCGKSCSDAQREVAVFASLGIELTADPTAKPKHNPCTFPLRKSVCRVVFKNTAT